MAGRNPTAVQYFVPENPQVARTTQQRLAEHLQDEMHQLASGLASDWGDYQRRVGRVQAFQISIRTYDEAKSEVEGERG